MTYSPLLACEKNLGVAEGTPEASPLHCDPRCLGAGAHLLPGARGFVPGSPSSAWKTAAWDSNMETFRRV